MYSSLKDGIPVVSDVQAYLDLFARGGRDLKRADYLFQARIEPMWGNKCARASPLLDGDSLIRPVLFDSHLGLN